MAARSKKKAKQKQTSTPFCAALIDCPTSIPALRMRSSAMTKMAFRREAS